VTRVVIAPDKFKGSVTAEQAAEAIAAGLLSARPDLNVAQFPVADGGEGTVAAAVSAGYELVPVLADGPTGEPVETAFAMHGGTAVVELADVTGLRRLPGPPAPLTASTYGVGQVISAALDRGATTIMLGIGGSASTDGGAGLLQALGVRLMGPGGTAAAPGARGGEGAGGSEIGRGGAALLALTAVDVAGLDQRLRDVTVLVATDVRNPLLGPSGAAAVFGPQKGATDADVALLERALARFAALTESTTGRDVADAPGAGAAGGTGFGALAYLGARLEPGVDLVLDLIGFDAALAGADLVVTGEGSLDAQSLGGKAPVGVARAAARHGVPAVAVAGRVLLTEAEIADAGFAAAYSLADLEPDPGASMANAADLLNRIGQNLAFTAFLSGPPRS
jgi:glycerate 2-kinase